MRVGWGVDAHRFQSEGTVVVAGVVADAGRGVAATSDGDVAVHAVIDALLGAAALGDIGTLFPPDDPASRDADSMVLLAEAAARVRAAGFEVTSVDVTIVAETVRVEPVRQEGRANLARALGVPVGCISVKATTTDGLGFIGRDEGIAALAVAVLGES